MVPDVYAYPKFVFYLVLVDAKGFAVFILVSRSLGLAGGLGNPELVAGGFANAGRLCFG